MSETHPSMRRAVLVIAVSDTMRRSISRILARVPFDVSTANKAADGLAMAAATSSDLVVVECGVAAAMPRYLGAVHAAAGAPVMLVGDDAAEGVRCLESGVVVDYVKTPIWERELRARAVRHAGGPDDRRVLDFGDLVIDLRARRVRLRGAVAQLTSREFDLLAFLAGQPGAVFTREELLEHVWRSSPEWQQVDTVSEHVYRLRRKVEPDPSSPRWIITLPRTGYSFSAPNWSASEPELSTARGSGPHG